MICDLDIKQLRYIGKSGFIAGISSRSETICPAFSSMFNLKVTLRRGEVYFWAFSMCRFPEGPFRRVSLNRALRRACLTVPFEE